MKRETLEALVKARAEKRSVVLATNLETGGEHIIFASEVASDPIAVAAHTCAASDKSQLIDIEGEGAIFFNVYNAPLRLIIVGAVHIAQPLSQMAALNDFEVHVIDPREAFASKDRFPNTGLSAEWPDKAIKALGPDARTAIVTLAHDPKIDDPALQTALQSDCFTSAHWEVRKPTRPASNV